MILDDAESYSSLSSHDFPCLFGTIHLTPATRVLIFAGTSVYAFEGIALVIPIRESMEKPEYFPHMLVAWMMLSRPRYSWIGGIAATPATMDGQYLRVDKWQQNCGFARNQVDFRQEQMAQTKKSAKGGSSSFTEIVGRTSASVFVVCPCVLSLGTPKSTTILHQFHPSGNMKCQLILFELELLHPQLSWQEK